MTRITYVLFQLSTQLCAVFAEDGGKKLPSLPPKHYEIGIAPSHITTPTGPLFQSTSQWSTVATNVDLFKYYGVQQTGAEWATDLDGGTLADFSKREKMNFGCEFGNFDLGHRRMPDPSIAAFRQLDPVFNAGGSVSSIHLDGPIRRMIQGVQKHPSAITLDEIAERMVDFWQKIHVRYPRMRIGLIVNLPNWDYTKDLVGYNGHFTDKSGVTYLEALDTVHQALTAAGKKMDFLEVDCPYNYYREKRTRNKDAAVDNAQKFTALQQWCKARDIDFHVVVNAEPRNQGAQGFHDLTCEYVRQLRRDGIFPDVFIIQSWYKQPAKNLPESETFTFMNTAKDAIALIQKLYPNKATRTSRSDGRKKPLPPSQQ